MATELKSFRLDNLDLARIECLRELVFQSGSMSGQHLYTSDAKVISAALCSLCTQFGISVSDIAHHAVVISRESEPTHSSVYGSERSSAPELWL